jgi:hypothetical protein
MLKFSGALAALAFAVSLAACSSVNTPSSEITENYSGTLSPLGQVSTNFNASKNGELQMTLTSLTPRPVVGFIALAIGQPVNGGCSPLIGYVVSQAAIGQQYSFGQLNKGSYCLLVADPNGALTTDTVFNVQYVHP